MARRHNIETRLTATDRTKAAFNRVQRRMKSLKKASLVAGGGIAALTAGFIAASKRAVNFGDDIAKTARQLNISTTAFQEMRLAADLAGVSEEKFGSGLAKLAKNIGEFREGTGTLVTFLDKLGDESFADLLRHTTDTEQAFRLFIKRMDQAANQQQKLALANAAFGRGVGQMLAGMSFKDLEKGIETARQFGTVIDEKLLKEAEKIKDAFTIVSAVFKKEFFSALLQQLKNMDLAKFAKEMAQLAKATLDVIFATAKFFNLVEEVQTPLMKVTKKIIDLENSIRILKNNARTQGDIQIAEFNKELDRLKEKLKEAKNLRDQLLVPTLKPLVITAPKVSKVRSVPEDFFREDAKANKISTLLDKLLQYRRNLEETRATLTTLNNTSFKNIEAMDSEIQRLETSKNVRKFVEDLRKKGLAISNEAVTALIAEADAVDAVNRALQKKRELLEPSPLQDYMNEIKSLRHSLEEVAVRGADGLTDSLQQMVNGTKSAKDAFKSMASSIIADLQRMIIKKYITDKIFGFITSAFAPGPKTGGLAAPGLAANGGPVKSGKPYIVGERGPELLIPNRNSNIIPNHELGGGGVNVVNNYDFSGANPATVMALRQEADRIKQDTFASVFSAIDRGGNYARVSGRR